MSDAMCAAPSHAPRATSSELALIKRASICFLSCRRTSKKCFKFNDTQEEGEEVLYWRDRVDCNFKDRNNWSWHTFCQLSITRWRIEEKVWIYYSSYGPRFFLHLHTNCFKRGYSYGLKIIFSLSKTIGHPLVKNRVKPYKLFIEKN